MVEGGTAIVCVVGKHESSLRCHRRRKACSRSSNSSLLFGEGLLNFDGGVIRDELLTQSKGQLRTYINCRGDLTQ